MLACDSCEIPLDRFNGQSVKKMTVQTEVPEQRRRDPASFNPRDPKAAYEVLADCLAENAREPLL